MKSLSATSRRYLAIIPVLFVILCFFIQTSTAQAESAQERAEASRAAVNTDKVTLQNPLNGINSIEGLLVAILNIIMILMVPVIVFFIIYAGFKYVMAQGNASQVEEATRALTYAIIGGVLILGALAISQIIQSVVTAFSAAP